MATKKSSTPKKSIPKAQSGAKVGAKPFDPMPSRKELNSSPEAKSFNEKKYKFVKGTPFSIAPKPNEKTKYVSSDGNYSLKTKTDSSGKRIKNTERRTLKGALSGVKKAPGKN